MVLCETLINTDIPYCNKMKEAIIYHWKRSFKELKVALLMSLPFLSLLLTSFINKNPLFTQSGWHYNKGICFPISLSIMLQIMDQS